MDLLASLGVLGILVFVLIELVQKVAPRLDGPLTILAALAVGIGATAVCAHSDFSAGVNFLGVPLDKMNGASQAIVGIFAGAAAVGIDVVLSKAIPSIGQNLPGKNG